MEANTDTHGEQQLANNPLQANTQGQVTSVEGHQNGGPTQGDQPGTLQVHWHRA